MSLGELERASGVGKGYLSELEQGAKGNPSVEIVQKISRALDVPVSKLLGETGAEGNISGTLPRGLKDFIDRAEQQGSPIPAEYVSWLQRIPFRGKKLRTAEDWAFLYDLIRRLE
jgi:transcriptional regulator with XRE-family HTH domain